ncbi:hypothetical protein VKT23_011979 [Stygiomarasmius scandens]|uniref:Cytochrome P450 n=1 Tax=Marasmiellus scandens TaxID=2682957 RepID=A0ABR1JCJ3_9AGAR
MQEHEAMRLVSYMVRNPDEWEWNVQRSTASTVLSCIFGLPPIGPESDDLVIQFDKFTSCIAKAAMPGAYLVELFPILNILPSWVVKWKRDALEWHLKQTEMLEGYLENVRERMHTGACGPCLCSSVLENNKKNSLTSKEIAWLAGALFGAGIETTAATLSVFILAMCLNPNVMHKAQAEIDRVVGRSRLPKFSDYDNLPYIRALVKEVLRWRPVAPAGKIARYNYHRGNFNVIPYRLAQTHKKRE